MSENATAPASASPASRVWCPRRPSLANLPELGDGRSRWRAVLDRTARSFFQVLTAAFVAGTALTDVDWPTIFVQAGVAATMTSCAPCCPTFPRRPAR